MRNGTALPLQVCISLHPAGSEAGGAGGRQLPSGGHHHGGGLHAVSKFAAADPKGFHSGRGPEGPASNPRPTLGFSGAHPCPCRVAGQPPMGTSRNRDTAQQGCAGYIVSPSRREKQTKQKLYHLGGSLVNEEGLLPPPHPPPLPPTLPTPAGLVVAQSEGSGGSECQEAGMQCPSRRAGMGRSR